MSNSNPEPKGELSKPEDDKGAEQNLEDNPAGELASAFKELPPEERKIVSSLFAQFSSGPVPSPIAKKITSEHISQLITNDESENEREYRKFLATENTRRWAIGCAVAVITIVLVYAGLTKDKELSEKVINVGLGALGGGGIAYAAGKQKKDK